MIPKIIHYCWLSDNPIPKSLQKCMKSWKKFLPDYEFIHWNFNHFDINSSVWVKQAFENKKYAFAADYIRLYALYHYGGIYLDMDVEVLKPFDDFLCLNSMICFENSTDMRLEVATIGVEKHSIWIKQCMDYYTNRSFVNETGFDTKVLPLIIRDILLTNQYSLIAINNLEEAKDLKLQTKQIPIFPCTFFSPKSYSNGHEYITRNTYSIHHFSGSWKPWYSRLEMKICNILGVKYTDYLFRHFT